MKLFLENKIIKTKEINFIIRYINTGNFDEGTCGKDAENERTKTNLIYFIISFKSY